MNAKLQEESDYGYDAFANDSLGRSSTNAVTVYIPSATSYSYDTNGNLLNDGTRYFTYDDENQLISAVVSNAWMSQFVYDGQLRRRIRREYTWQSGWVQTNEIHYVYDGNAVIQERDGNNLPSVNYTRGNDLSGSLQGAGGIGGLLARQDYNGPAFYHSDGNGNVTAMINSSQSLVAKYLYDPFGNTLPAAGSLPNVNLYRFSSKELHLNSGLIYYGYRFYDPNLQRWLNRDPIGELGGLNLYAVCNNNIISRIDPEGTSFFGSIIGLLPVAGTIYNAFVSPAGSSVSDYKIHLSGCDLDPDEAERKCKADVGIQETKYVLGYGGLNLAHEVVDGFAGLLSAATVYVPIALAIDGATDLGISFYKISQINKAANTAKAKCKCSRPVVCHPNAGITYYENALR